MTPREILERRKHARMPAGLPTMISSRGAPDCSAEVSMTDLSAGGVGFTVPRDQAELVNALCSVPGEMRVEIDLGSGARFQAAADLMWGSLEVGARNFVLTAGIRFDSVADRDQAALLRFLAGRTGSRSGE